ncbi:hypothetical protein A6A25_32420 [Saccharothrix sp. CB00851]|nr:hypothetical protein A6A25_32420 [Saccharothrix sp. CB00851]
MMPTNLTARGPIPFRTDMENPLEGVSPNFDLLGSGVITIVAILWGLCFLGAALFLAKGFLQYAAAKKQGMVENVGEAAKEVKQALVAVAGLVALPAIVGLVITVMGQV